MNRLRQQELDDPVTDPSVWRARRDELMARVRRTFFSQQGLPAPGTDVFNQVMADMRADGVEPTDERIAEAFRDPEVRAWYMKGR